MCSTPLHDSEGFLYVASAEINDIITNHNQLHADMNSHKPLGSWWGASTSFCNTLTIAELVVLQAQLFS